MSAWITDKRVVIVAAVLAVLGVSFAVVQLSAAAFSATTTSAQNSWATGQVAISDNMTGAAAFAVTNLVPGDTVRRCIVVTYSGTVDAEISMFVSDLVDEEGLASYLDVDVVSGSGLAGTTGVNGSCTGFNGATTYTGLPKSLDDLAADHTDHDSGLDPAWDFVVGQSTTRTYRIEVTLEGDEAPQGEAATALFNWGARSS